MTAPATAAVPCATPPPLRSRMRGVCRRLRVVRRIAQELGVDLAEVGGSGPGGRITEDDVRASGASAEGRREPLRGVRRVIAEHMTRAHREVPPVTWVEECDFEDVPLERLVPTVVKACADALVEFPELNARFDGDAIVYLDRYDIGVAVQTDDGLVVPVVRERERKLVDELARRDRGARRARAHGLARSRGRSRLDLHRDERRQARRPLPDADRQPPGGRDPEHRSRRRRVPVVRDGEIVVRRIGTLAITFDHRVVDGARAAAFGLAVIARIQETRRASARRARTSSPTSRRAGRRR